MYQIPVYNISDSSYPDVTGVRVRLALFCIPSPSSPGMPKTPSTNSARPALRRNQVFANSLYNLMCFGLFSVRHVVHAADESSCALHFLYASLFAAYYLSQKCDAARPHCGTCVRYVESMFVFPSNPMWIEGSGKT